MDVDEDMLDWGANDDDEGTQHRGNAAAEGQGRIATKDEATLSGAESLLALAFGGTVGDDKDDKDSDVVSLGGGDDDMQELYAYQSRTNLGGTAAGDSTAGAPSASATATDAVQERKGVQVPQATSTSNHTSQQQPTVSRAHSPEITRPNSKTNSQAKSRSNDPTRSPSFARIVPPTGSLALPPKPVTVPPTSSVRPSHPSIMSASSMRERDLQRENRDAIKGKSGPHNRSSPEGDSLPLAPGWETRRSRGDSQDIYYYNIKTHQTTWHRNIATGMASGNADGSSSPTYARNRGRDTAKSSGRQSPTDRDISQSRRTDLGSQPRTRASRFDQLKAEPNLRPVPSPLSFDERHYRPDETRSPPRASPHDGGNFRPQRMSGSGAPAFRREPSPTSIPTRPPLPHRDTDRDRPVSRHEQDRERGTSDRMPPSLSNGRSIDRNGERNVERERSRSPGRGRMFQSSWRNETVIVRDNQGSAPRNKRASDSIEDSGPFGGSSPPARRGEIQATRSGSPGYDNRPRYPNNEQSSARDRNRSPPAPERPNKRARSTSPFNTNNRSSIPRLPPQAPHNQDPWGDAVSRQRDGYHQPNQFATRDRQRLPPQGSNRPLGRSGDSSRNNDGDDNHFTNREYDDANDAKRRKTFEDPDSAAARRRLPVDLHNDRDITDAPKRAPLPPQAERFKEMASPPSSQLSLPRNASNTFPPSAPSGPKRVPFHDNPSNMPLSNRHAPYKNEFVDPRAPAGVVSRSRFGDGKSIPEGIFDEKDREKPRGRERGRDSYADLPTGPRAMDDAATRRARSPPRHNRHDRSSPPLSRSGHRQPERWDESVDLTGSRRHFENNDWERREHDRQMGPHIGGNYENNRTPPPRGAFPPNSRFGQLPQHQQQRSTFTAPPHGPTAPPRRPNYSQVSPVESYPPQITDPHPSRMGIPPARQRFTGGDRQNRRFSGPNSPQDGPRPLEPETQRRRSFSSVAPPHMERNRTLPQAPRASLSPANRVNTLPSSSHSPLPPFEQSHTSVQKPSNPQDRLLLPEEEDTQAVWRKDDAAKRFSSVGVRRDNLSEDPNAEYGVASPPFSHSQLAASSSSHPERQEEHLDVPRSPKPGPANRRPNNGDVQMEGPPLPLQSSVDKGRNEPHQSTTTGVQSERAPKNPPETIQRRTPPPPRVRRFSKMPDSHPPHPESAGPPSFQEQVQQHAPRAGSLLDRLSNPVPPRGSPAPHLRDRMGLPGGIWKPESGSPQGLSMNADGPQSLRDRVQPFTDARRSEWNTPDSEWINNGFEDGGGDFRARRGGRPRKRGRGQ